MKICWICVLLSMHFHLSAPDNFSFFEGKWNFSIWFTGNNSNQPDISAIWKLEKGLTWIECYIGSVTISGKKFTSEMIIFHPILKKYKRTVKMADGSLVTLESAGWNQDAFIWEGHLFSNGKVILLREEIFRENTDEFEALFFNLQNEEWVLTQREKLKKSIS